MSNTLKQDHPQSIQVGSMPISAPPFTTGTWASVLTLIGTVGPVFFLVVATVAGFLQPGYDLRTQMVSELALGPNGWLQTANFFVFGLAIIAFAFGLCNHSRVGRGLLVLVGVSLFASGLYPTDLKGAPETSTGAIHNLLSLIIFLSLIVFYSFAAFAMRNQPGWHRYMRVTSLLPIAIFALLFVFVAVGSDLGDPLYAVSGLIQRALLIVAFSWLTITGYWLLKKANTR